MKKILLLIISAFTFISCENAEVSNGRNLYQMYFHQTLRDPQSFVVYDEKFELEENVKVIWKLEYGARNGFGGMVRDSAEIITIGEMLFVSGSCFELEKGELIRKY